MAYSKPEFLKKLVKKSTIKKVKNVKHMMPPGKMMGNKDKEMMDKVAAQVKGKKKKKK